MFNSNRGTLVGSVTAKKVNSLKGTKKLNVNLKNEINNFQKTKLQEDYYSSPGNISTPPPVKGRVNAETTTEEYVEILTDKPPMDETNTQTDFYLDRPMKRLFIP